MYHPIILQKHNMNITHYMYIYLMKIIVHHTYILVRTDNIMAQADIQITFVPTKRGGRLLVRNGYKFRVNNKKDTWISWKCVERGCLATLCTRNDLISKIGNDHHHPPAAHTVAVSKVMQNIKKRAFEEITPIPTIYNDELVALRTDECPDNVARHMPTFQQVKDSLYRQRRKKLPSLPKNRSSIHLEEEWTRTLSDDDFLQINDGDDNKILVFSTIKNMRYLSTCPTVYGDGTFFASPHLFLQIYTLHGFVDGQMFPLVYSFLPDKSQATYERLFRLLRIKAGEYNIDINPVRFQMDYEKAAHNAVRHVFPDAEVRGCFFHFTQCIWRQVQKLGLQSIYQTDTDLHKFVRRISALPLVPENLLDEVWIEIANQQPDTESATKLADYFTETWMEGQFPPSVWNHHGNDGPRTTNHLEGWHSKLNRAVMKAHPNLFEIINILKKEQAANEVKLLQLEGGAQPPSKKRKYKIIDDRLSSLKRQLASNIKSPLEYTDSVSFLLHL